MRSISQIYAEALQVRNNYLQLTELNVERSKSKMSIINLLTYVMSALIYSYEAILSAFEVEVANIINSRVNGTGIWYAEMAKKFQYNPNTESNDAMIYNNDTLNLEYDDKDDSKRIIANAVYEEVEYENSIHLKVCKNNTDSDEVKNGTPYMPLTDLELSAFKAYIKRIKFVGAIVHCISCPADILTIKCSKTAPIYYDNNYITKDQAMEAIKTSVINFIRSHTYNNGLYYQKVVDILQETEHIITINSDVEVYLTSYNEQMGEYDPTINVKAYTTLASGYMKIIDEQGECTINTENIVLQPKTTL